MVSNGKTKQNMRKFKEIYGKAKKKIEVLLQNSLLQKCFNESNVHCVPLITKPKRHFCERFIWLLIIGISIYCTVLICLSQWHKYNEFPTVIYTDTNYRMFKFKYPGITICSNYSDPKTTALLINRYWNVTETESPKYKYYEKYLLSIAKTRYDNLNGYTEFINDSTLDGINMLELATEMRGPLIDPLSTTDQTYTTVITEYGVCFSSTYLSRHQNPFVRNKINPVNETISIKNRTCTYFDSCSEIVDLHRNESKSVRIFFHHQSDVISAKETMEIDVIGDFELDLEIQFREKISTDGIANLSIKKRKCRFIYEVESIIFDHYTLNLCLISCRIERTIAACGCIPFFYNTGLKKPICTAYGMDCLAKKSQWYNTTLCNCYELCTTTSYLKTKIVQKPIAGIFQVGETKRVIRVSYVFPTFCIVRDIFLTMENLFSYFGSIAGLFLGCSFISIIEFLYFILEDYLGFCCNKIRR